VSRAGRLVLSATILLSSLAACRPAKDSYIVIHSDVDCDVPRIFQLRVTISNNGRSDQKTLPEIASAELGFPSSVVLSLPNARSGAVDLAIEALDDKRNLIGQASVSGTIAVGGRIDLQVQIRVVKGSSGATCGNGVLEPGEECDDGNRISGDGCSFNCMQETNGSIDGGTPGRDGGNTPQDLAAAASGPAFAQIAVGAHSTCALRADSSLWCWGSNSYGQLLLSNTSNRLTPVELAGAAWAQTACGQTHTCAVRGDGTMSCWGNNASGQLGAATTTLGNTKTEVVGGPWQSVAAGSYQSCGIVQNGTLWCWGDNTNGQLGIGSTLPSSTPAMVAGQTWRQVSTSYLHSCAVKADGSLWCWGLNANLQLGVSSVAFSMVPSPVAGTDWKQAATGLYHSCGIKSDATLWCWGGNSSGQLGSASVPMLSTAQTSDPVPVTTTAWKIVSAGQSHTCAVALDGSLWCWGDNTHGQLGDKTQASKSTPVAVAVTGLTWTAVVAGVSHTCALATDGSLWCWGDNSAGQLGIGSNEEHLAPTRVVQ
jgi:cysteine-rich repeat protein